MHSPAQVYATSHSQNTPKTVLSTDLNNYQSYSVPQSRGRSLTRKYGGNQSKNNSNTNQLETMISSEEIDRSKPPSVRDIAAKFAGNTDPRKFTENLRRAPAQSYMRRFQSESDKNRRKNSDRSAQCHISVSNHKVVKKNIFLFLGLSMVYEVETAFK